MTITDLGSVLLAMSEYARERASYHNSSNPNGEASALMWSIAFTLQAGAERCLTIAEAEQAERKQQEKPQTKTVEHEKHCITHRNAWAQCDCGAAR